MTTLLSLFFGMLWGGVNFFLLKQLLFALVMSAQKNFLKIYLIALVKFPLLYFAGYLLLVLFDPWYLLLGLTVTLVLSPFLLYRRAI